MRTSARGALARVAGMIAIASLVAGCGGDDPNAGKSARGLPTKSKPRPKPETKADATSDTGAAKPDDDGGAGWETDGETESDIVGETEGAKEAYRGPCKIRWTNGTKLTFDYKDDGGSVKIDSDGDGKVDVCGKFKAADGRTKQVEIDQGCDKKNDLKIRPKYSKKSNLATATYTTVKDDAETKLSMTLVAMPSFSGLDPGYPLHAKKSDIGLKIRKGLVRSAHVKKPNDGVPESKVEFRYDDDGRIKSVREDLGADGSVDRRFDYRYDDVGNVSRIRYTLGDKKGSAKIDYSCWD